MRQLYVHGLGQTPDSWKAVLDGLGAPGDCLCPDLAELASGEGLTYSQLYGAFSRYCDRWTGALDLCGLSLGSILALHYAAQRPERVRSLVLIAPQYQMPRRLLTAQNLLFRLLPSSLFPQTGFSKSQFYSCAAAWRNWISADCSPVSPVPFWWSAGAATGPTKKPAPSWPGFSPGRTSGSWSTGGTSSTGKRRSSWPPCCGSFGPPWAERTAPEASVRPQGAPACPGKKGSLVGKTGEYDRFRRWILYAIGSILTDRTSDQEELS